MRFGIRKPSLRSRISARTSWKRVIRHQMGIKAPRGYGFLTNPKKALYNRAYNRTTVSVDSLSKSPRANRRFEPIVSSEFGEMAVAGLVAAVIMVIFLVWLGFSLKWALIVTAIAGIGAVLGEQAMKGLVLLFFVTWFFLH